MKGFKQRRIERVIERASDRRALRSALESPAVVTVVLESLPARRAIETAVESDIAEAPGTAREAPSGSSSGDPMRTEGRASFQRGLAGPPQHAARLRRVAETPPAAPPAPAIPPPVVPVRRAAPLIDLSRAPSAMEQAAAGWGKSRDRS